MTTRTAPATDDPIAWHTLPTDEVFARLDAGPAGLTAEEAARRRAEHGPNALPDAARVTLHPEATVLFYVRMSNRIDRALTPFVSLRSAQMKRRCTIDRSGSGA